MSPFMRYRVGRLLSGATKAELIKAGTVDNGTPALVQRINPKAKFPTPQPV